MKNTTMILSEALLSGEPTFLIRAKDSLSIPTLVAYSNTALYSNCTDEFLDEIETIKENFEDWQMKNLDLVKIPD